MKIGAKDVALNAVMAALLLALSLWAWFKPAQDSSESERKQLAKAPQFTFADFVSGDFADNFEDYAVDQFPAHDEFRTLKALAAYGPLLRKDNNGLYLEDGYLSKLEYPLNEKMLDHAADRMRNVYNMYMADKDVKVYFSVIPDKNRFLAPSSGRLCMDYDALCTYMRDKTDDFAEYIDIFPLLSIDDYYRTDTHWRQEKITDVADKLLEAMGAEGDAQYTENVLPYAFNGVYRGQSALPVKPDELKYLTSDALDKCRVQLYSDGEPKDSVVYNLEKGAGRDPYELFLSGSEPYIVIDNPAADSDRELVIFRDSFGSSLAPLLVEGYSRVTLVDIRYMQPKLLSEFMEFGEQDVLFIYSTLLLNSSLGMR